MKKGRVSLVGAGPGDPGLLTLKAQKRLSEADLIIYDTLANPEHLIHAKPSARTFCVGQGFRHKKLSQEKINRMILQEARKGKYVVRLKGGDPYLFGRGGEEALLLVENNIPFEVVPGVTSATGCAAYAGIPLTHREHNASVTFLTGHRAEDESLDSIDWKKIVSLQGTLVIYMGFYNLRKITELLIRYGMVETMPVAVVEWGTLPYQRSCDGTLADIAGRVEKDKFKAPCIIIVGEVVKLREKLNWFEQLPLFGKRVLVTRMREKAGTLADKFRSQGAAVIELPVIRIERTPDRRAMEKAVKDLQGFDWLIFTSAYGVESLFTFLSGKKKDARLLSGIKIACVGPGTSAALRQHGLIADLAPQKFESAALVPALKKTGSLKGKRILLLRTDIVPKTLEQALKREGAITQAVTAYHTRREKTERGPLNALLQEPPDFITFASASAAQNFAEAMGKKNAKVISRQSAVATIGPVTSRSAKKLGMKVACQAKRFDTDGLVEAVRVYSEKQK